MADQEKFKLDGEADIVNIRMEVREFARYCGFSLADQACISMAVSSLAYSLGFARENSPGGEVIVERYTHQHRKGLRVYCIKSHTEDSDRDLLNHLGNSRMLVDHIEVKPSKTDGLEVTMIKYSG